jgi:hypothetical protein
MGYSVGRWEGDTLIVESIGFKDRTWLDFAGTPHSEALRITERIRRPRFGQLEIEETIDDPEVFTRPFTVSLGAHLTADSELLEYVCAENERSRQRLVGRASEEIRTSLANAVNVAPEILAKYAGVYDMRFPENPATPNLLPLRAEGNRLFAGDGPPLIPLSDTIFASPFGRIEFVVDARGVVTHLLLRVVEGDKKAPRVASQ